MDYIELNKRFWLTHSIALFSTNEIALYMYLLESYRIATEVGCKDKFFSSSNRKIIADLNISFNTYNKARINLKNHGMIDFIAVPGSTITKYTLEETFEQTLSNFDKVGDEVSDKVSDEVKEENPPTPPKEENIIMGGETLPKGSEPTPLKKIFSKPSIKEIEDFVKEKGLNVDAERFFYYYEANGWVCGRGNKMKSWQAACFNWSRSEFFKSSAAQIIHKQKDTVYENF